MTSFLLINGPIYNMINASVRSIRPMLRFVEWTSLTVDLHARGIVHCVRKWNYLNSSTIFRGLVLPFNEKKLFDLLQEPVGIQNATDTKEGGCCWKCDKRYAAWDSALDPSQTSSLKWWREQFISPFVDFFSVSWRSCMMRAGLISYR